MKRFICLLLALSLMLSGCGFFGSRIKEPVTFYYLCDRYEQDLCCVIVTEEREASGHQGDLSYLLALYLMGPIEEEVSSPLRSGSKISATMEEGHVFLDVTEAGRPLSDIDFSLACACLTLTCLEIVEAQDVTIRSGERSKTMNAGILTLYDTAPETTPTEGSQ